MRKDKGFGVSALSLKIFAIIVMTANHLGEALEGLVSETLTNIMIGVGGATYIIMSYLLAEGYRHTRSVFRYALRLFIFALLAQPGYSMHPERLTNFNVLFTLFLALMAIHATKRIKNAVVSVVIVTLCVFLSGFCDWGYVGVLIALAFFWIPDRRTGAAVAVGIAVAQMGGPALRYYIRGYEQYLTSILYTFVGCVSGGFAVCLYNGKRGGKEKRGFLGRYFFYLYYGVHLLAIDLFMYFAYRTPLVFNAPYPFPTEVSVRVTEWITSLISRIPGA